MTRIFDLDELGKVLAEAGAERVQPALAAAANGGRLSRLDADVRDAVHRLGERVLAAAYEQLGAALRAATHRASGEPTQICDCGRPMRLRQMRSCAVRTVLTGQPQDIRSPYWVCDHCRVGVLGLRTALDLDGDGFPLVPVPSNLSESKVISRRGAEPQRRARFPISAALRLCARPVSDGSGSGGRRRTS